MERRQDFHFLASPSNQIAKPFKIKVESMLGEVVQDTIDNYSPGALNSGKVNFSK